MLISFSIIITAHSIVKSAVIWITQLFISLKYSFTDDCYTENINSSKKMSYLTNYN